MPSCPPLSSTSPHPSLQRELYTKINIYHSIPDVSVGSCWGKHWIDQNLDGQLGERIQWDHYYPDYYPQAKSNPQDAWAYPDKALPLFRQWFRTEYLTTKFPAYILRKADSLLGGPKEAKQIAQLYDQPASVRQLG